MAAVHPAAQPVIAALVTLAEYRPTGPGDLANLLAAVHDPFEPSILTEITRLLQTLAIRAGADPAMNNPQAGYTAGHLTAAADRISNIGDEYVDRAREAAWGGAR